MYYKKIKREQEIKGQILVGEKPEGKLFFEMYSQPRRTKKPSWRSLLFLREWFSVNTSYQSFKDLSRAFFMLNSKDTNKI